MEQKNFYSKKCHKYSLLLAATIAIVTVSPVPIFPQQIFEIRCLLVLTYVKAIIV